MAPHLNGLLEPGRLVFCTDIGYAPMEFFDGDAASGADIEVAREVARRLGLEAKFVDEAVAGIVDALYARRGDLIINAFTDSAARRQRLTFVDYLLVGQTALTRKADAVVVRTVEDLAGRKVAVQGDVSNELSLRA